MTKKAVFLSLLAILWTTGFSQTLSFKFGIPFRRTDLDVRWNMPTNSLPTHVWVYQLLPNHFNAEGISNLIALGGFTPKEKTKDDADWLVYNTPDSSRRLGILFPLGSLEYEIRETHGPTNLVQAVPSESEAVRLTTNWLSKLGIEVSDIEHREDGGPNFHVFDSQTMYFVNGQVITNTEFRGVRFRRWSFVHRSEHRRKLRVPIRRPWEAYTNLHFMAEDCQSQPLCNSIKGYASPLDTSG